jgi:uncharacterized lipoprotein YbaY
MRSLLRLLILAALLAGCGQADNSAPSASRPDSAAASGATATAPGRPTAAIPSPEATAPPTLTLPPPHEAAATQRVPATDTPALPTEAAPGAVGDSTLSGLISYPADSALPTDAVLSVQLRLGMRPFLYDTVGLEQIIPLGPGPTPFSYAYDPNAIDATMPYSLVAEVRAGGRRLLTGSVPALVGGAAEEIELDLYPVPTADTVSGSVTYPGGSLLAPGAALSVKLVAPVDGVGGWTSISEQQITPDQSGRADFSLPIDPAVIDPYVAYTVLTELTAPGRLTLFSESLALTYGAPASLAVELSPIPGLLTLGGNALLPAGMTLPADAVLSVQIAYVYNGVISSVERSHTFAPGGAGPVPFLIEYLPAGFTAGDDHYALYASVRQGPKLLLTTPLIPLNPSALPANIDVTLQPPAMIGRVEGTIAYPAAAALPADARLVVQLADMRYVGGDGVPIVVAEQIVAPVGAAPISFAIEYDPLAMDGRSEYAILTEITAGGRPIFSGPWAYVLTNGKPNQVDITLEPAR